MNRLQAFLKSNALSYNPKDKISNIQNDKL